MILSHSLARLERMRSNLLPTGGAELGETVHLSERGAESGGL